MVSQWLVIGCINGLLLDLQWLVIRSVMACYGLLLGPKSRRCGVSSILNKNMAVYSRVSLHSALISGLPCAGVV